MKKAPIKVIILILEAMNLKMYYLTKKLLDMM